jgi:hypothetical protein
MDAYLRQTEEALREARKVFPGAHARIYQPCPCGCGYILWKIKGMSWWIFAPLSKAQLERDAKELRQELDNQR